MSSQEKWITSGASRLKAMQNRGFTFRAKQKASSMVTTVVHAKREGGGRSQCQPSKRPKIVVGETAVSQITCHPIDCAADNFTDDNIQSERRNRRIREVPSGVQPRQQVMVEEEFCPPAHSAGTFANAPTSHARYSYRCPEGILPGWSNESHPSDASAFADGGHSNMTSDLMRKYDRSSDTPENPFLSRRIGTRRYPLFPSDPRGGATDALGPVRTSLGANRPHPSSNNGVPFRQMLQERSDFLPGEDCFASGHSDLADAASVAWERRERTSPIQNEGGGGSNGPADFIRRLVAAQSGSAISGAPKHVGHSRVALPRDQFDQHDRIGDGADFLMECEDSAPHYIIYVGGKECPPKQTEGNNLDDEEATNRSPPIRFFDAGVEISMYGRPLKHARDTPCRSPKRDKEQAQTEGDEAFRILQEHQRSIWDQFGDETECCSPK